jgi:integrase
MGSARGDQPLSSHVVLTYAYLRSLKPAPKGKRYFVNDALVPGLQIMVTDRGTLSYGMKRRWPGQKQPTWHKMGGVYVQPKKRSEDGIDTGKIEHGGGVLLIVEARNIARFWVDNLSRKVDPAAAEKAQKAEEKRLQEEAAAEAEREKATRFCVVAQAFDDLHLSTLAKAGENSRIVRQIYVRAWQDRPVKDITPTDVLAVIKPIVAAGKKYQALNVFRIGSRLYSWAAGNPEYGTEGYNPFALLSPKTVIGDTPPRDRWLRPDELRAVWQASDKMGGPQGAVIKLLILTTKRLNEIAKLSWSEVNLDNAEIIVPGRRMKGRNAPDHLLPLTAKMAEIINAMPRFSGPYVFSTTAGRRPISLGDKVKRAIDEKSGVQNWTWHDLRRTARTHLSALPVEEHLREAILAHVRKGIAKTYDLYGYEAEKRTGLELLEKRLMAIVNPAPPDVTDLNEERERRVAAAALGT